MLKDLFSKNWFIFFVLVSLLFFQLVYSFLFPSVGDNGNWQPISTYLPKFTVESSDSFLLEKISPLISSRYRLNSDISHYLEMARGFSREYFKDNIFLERPLYSVLIFLFSLPSRLIVSPSYGIIFGSAILVNFALISAAVLLFFFFLKNLFSLKVAWLSSVLLIFSPFIHTYLAQPLAEMLMVFAVVLAAFLLVQYVKKPTIFKLIVFSLIAGILMLGKMFFAVSIFVLLLAAYFRRYKEGAVFLVIHLMPFLLWYLWVTRIWHINYYSQQVQGWDMGIWVFGMIFWPWQKIYQTLFGVFPDFVSTLLYAFLITPVIFSAIGWSKLPFKSRARAVFYFGSLFSVLLLGFFAKEFYLRHVFLLFPIIYPTAVMGIEKIADYLKQYRVWLGPVFYVAAVGFIILISSINIYQIFDYNDTI